MADIISKKETQAFQRWKLESLELPVTPEESAEATEAGETVDSARAEQEDLASVEETGPSIEEQLAELREQAHEEGYAAGYQAGKEAAEVELKAIAEKLMMPLSELDQDLLEIDQQIAEDVLNLALTLTKQMIGQALQIRPEILLPIVQEAIRQLPRAAQHPMLVLHPDDAAIIREHLGDQLAQTRWEIREDTQIKQGGCRLEVEGSEVDATLETRWKRVLATIGQENNWLE